jgi:phospholipase/carboxylesterase
LSWPAFPRGGAIALHTGLLYGRQLAAILAMSMHLPLIRHIVPELSPLNRKIPIMMAHGNRDPVVPMAKAIETRQELISLGYDISWHEYPMQHSVSEDEIDDIRSWLIEVLT